MKCSVAKQFSKKKGSLLVLPFWSVDKKTSPAFDKEAYLAPCKEALGMGDFKGEEGELYLIYHEGFRILLLGLGKEKEISLEKLRRAYAEVIKLCHKKEWEKISLILPETTLSVEGIADGLFLTNYRFTLAQDKKLSQVQEIELIGAKTSDLKHFEKVKTVTASVDMARELINRNADEITAEFLSKKAQKIAADHKEIRVKVLGKKELEKEGMALLLAVNRSSAIDPALITLHYQGNPASKELTAVIGKGITYDTGGLNIKTSGMETMKCDMSGAAAVLGTIEAAAKLGLKVNLVGVIAATENAIGPKSYKVGDVYGSFLGKTVEITNTDAEGRLVLADAIAYTEKTFAPTEMIDFATLTGGIVVAIGDEASGLFSNEESLAKKLVAAGEKTGERMWPMPLFPEYRELMKSPIADIKNSAERKASPVQGAIFIADFVKKTPWAHIDIAGTAYLSKPRRYHSSLATGVGIRLMISFLEKEIS